MANLTMYEELIYLYALRYAMSRRTNALSNVTDCMEKRIKDFSIFFLHQAKIESQALLEMSGMKRTMDDCDVDMHKRLQRMCKTELERRGERDYS